MQFQRLNNDNYSSNVQDFLPRFVILQRNKATEAVSFSEVKERL